MRLPILVLAGAALLAWQGVARLSTQTDVQAVHTAGGKTVAAVKTKPANRLVGATTVSSNWSGYVDSAGPYAGVRATWTVPALSNEIGGSVAEWVGIGGTGQNSDLLQCGVIDGWSGGQPVATAFTESLPAPATPGKTVAPGTSVTASVSPAGPDSWTLVVRSGSTILASQTVTLSAADAEMVEQSAEWIVEAPSTGSGRLEPLATFSPVTFRAATAETTSGQSESMAAAGTPASFTLVSMDGLQAQPGTVGSDGESFTVSESTAQAQYPYAETFPYGHRGLRAFRGFGSFGGYGGYGGYGGFGRRGGWGWTW